MISDALLHAAPASQAGESTDLLSGFMDFDALLSGLAPVRELLSQQPLLALAIGAMVVATLGTMLSRSAPRLGGLFRLGGNLGLAAVLILTVMQVSRLSPGFDLAMPDMGMPRQSVVGGETRIPLSRDGHYWIAAELNGSTHRFLVDTGATVTAISPETAKAGLVEPRRMRMPVTVRTANGSAPGQLATIGELRAGNVVARDLDAIIAPSMGGMNVLGMNFLSRLKSWRVEDGTLILVPGDAEE